MQPATTLTIASVCSSITGSGTSSKRMSPGAWIVVARMIAILPRDPWGANPPLRGRDGQARASLTVDVTRFLTALVLAVAALSVPAGTGGTGGSRPGARRAGDRRLLLRRQRRHRDDLRPGRLLPQHHALEREVRRGAARAGRDGQPGQPRLQRRSYAGRAHAARDGHPDGPDHADASGRHHHGPGRCPPPQHGPLQHPGVPGRGVLDLPGHGGERRGPSSTTARARCGPRRTSSPPTPTSSSSPWVATTRASARSSRAASSLGTRTAAACRAAVDTARARIPAIKQGLLADVAALRARGLREDAKIVQLGYPWLQVDNGFTLTDLSGSYPAGDAVRSLITDATAELATVPAAANVGHPGQMTFVGGVTTKFSGHEPDAQPTNPQTWIHQAFSGPDTNIWYHPNDLGQIAYSELLLAGGTYGAGTGTPPTTTPTTPTTPAALKATLRVRPTERRFERSEPVDAPRPGPPLGRHDPARQGRRTSCAARQGPRGQAPARVGRRPAATAGPRPRRWSQPARRHLPRPPRADGEAARRGAGLTIGLSGFISYLRYRCRHG